MAKTVAKIQVTAIFLLQDTRRSQIYRDLSAGNQQKHLSLRFATKGEIYLSRNSKTIKIIRE